MTELRELGRADKTGIDKETKRISDALRPGSLTVLLDPDGTEWTSQQLAAQVRSWEETGSRRSRLSWRTQWFGRRFQIPSGQALVAVAVDADARDGTGAVI